MSPEISSNRPAATSETFSSDAKRWLDTIRFSLADLAARGEWDDYGLYRILNRITYPCRNHIFFVVGFTQEHDEIVGSGKRKLRGDFISPIASSLDPVFFEMIFECLESNSLIGQNLNYKQFRKSYQSSVFPDAISIKNHKSFSIPIWDTKGFIICFKLSSGKVVNGMKPTTELALLKKQSDIGQFITACLRPFDGRSSDSTLPRNLQTKRAHVPGMTTKLAFGELEKANVFRIATQDDPSDNKHPQLSSTDFAIAERALAQIEDLVAYEFEQRLSKAPIINRRNHGVTNAFFWSKAFTSRKVRYGEYFYDSWMMLPKKQELQILRGFENAQEADFIPFGNKSAHNSFWSKIGTEKGVSELVSLVRKPIPENTRLFTDSVLMSGTILIKPDFFNRSAIGWIDASSGAAELSQSLLQLATYHYVLQLASPVWPPTSTSNLSVVALPYRCSGGIWMSSVFIRENYSADKEREFIADQLFEESTLVYHSIFKEVERRLRRRARGRYIDALGEIVASKSLEAQERHRDNKKALLTLDGTAIDAFRIGARALRRVYPFDGVTIENKVGPNELVPLRDFEYSSQENEFFDRLTLHSFLNDEENIQKLQQSIILSSIFKGVQ